MLNHAFFDYQRFVETYAVPLLVLSRGASAVYYVNPTCRMILLDRRSDDEDLVLLHKGGGGDYLYTHIGLSA